MEHASIRRARWVAGICWFVRLLVEPIVVVRNSCRNKCCILVHREFKVGENPGCASLQEPVKTRMNDHELLLDLGLRGLIPMRTANDRRT